MKFVKKPSFYSVLFVVCGSFVLVFVSFAQTFNEPTSAFPGGSPSAPVDTSSLEQSKSGVLNLGALNFPDGAPMSPGTTGNYWLNSSGICLKESATAPSPICKQNWNMIG